MNYRQLGVNEIDFPPVFDSILFGTGNGESEAKNTLKDFFIFRFADRDVAPKYERIEYAPNLVFLEDLGILASRFIAAKEASADVIEHSGRSTSATENFTAPEGTPIFQGGALPANSLGGTFTEQTGTPSLDPSMKTKMLRFPLDVIDDALDFFEPLFSEVYDV